MLESSGTLAHLADVLWEGARRLGGEASGEAADAPPLQQATAAAAASWTGSEWTARAWSYVTEGSGGDDDDEDRPGMLQWLREGAASLWQNGEDNDE